MSLCRAGCRKTTQNCPPRPPDWGHTERVRGWTLGSADLSSPRAPHLPGPWTQGLCGGLGENGGKDRLQSLPNSPRVGQSVDTRSGSVAAPRHSSHVHGLPVAASPTRIPPSGEARRACPRGALTLLCPLQTDRALWTVQLQRKLPGKEVRRAVPAEPAALRVDPALLLCAGPGQRVLALLRPRPG